MAALQLDKRKFSWLNDNDGFFIFQKDRDKYYDGLPDEEKLTFNGDSWNEAQIDLLYQLYEHLEVHEDDTLWAFDGKELIYLTKADEIYESAKLIK